MSKSLIRSTAVVGTMTMVSRILGLVRDVVIAKFFGATIGTDAFFVAFKIPNLFRRLFAEGAFNQAFVPVLAEYKEERPAAEAVDLIGAAVGSLSAVLLGVTALGVLAAPWVIAVFAPGFVDDQHQWDLASGMLRWTFPYLLFISLTALFGGVINTYGRFAIPAITPALLNIVLIAAALLLAPRMPQPIVALAIGVFVAGVAQLGLQFIAVKRLGLFGRVRVAFRDSGVVRILRLMGPAVFGASVSQINLLIDTLIASLLAAGSISWLYYSDRLVEFPLGVFGIALATVILPSLSREHSAGNREAFSNMLDWALRLVLLIAVPAALGLALLAAPMISTIFEYGQFDTRDVTMAARSLMAYSFGLIAFIVIKVLAPGFYARQDTKTPVKIGVVAMLTNVVLNIALMIPLAHAGLALATSLAAFVNAFLLFHVLRKRGVYQPLPGWVKFSVTVAVASAMMAITLYLSVPLYGSWHEAPVFERVSELAQLIVIGAVVYGVSLLLLGFRPRDVAQPRAV